MDEINLLPWRQQQREHEQQVFYRHALFAVAVSMMLLMGIRQYVGHKVWVQLNINQRLTEEIHLIDTSYKTLTALKKTREALIARIKVIHDLKVRNQSIFTFLYELPGCLKTHLYLYRMEQSNYKFTLQGYAESNSGVARLLSRLQTYSFIDAVALQDIKRIDHNDHRYPYEFTLSCRLRGLTRT